MDKYRPKLPHGRPRPRVAFHDHLHAGLAFLAFLRLAVTEQAWQPQDGTERAEFVAAREPPVE